MAMVAGVRFAARRKPGLARWQRLWLCCLACVFAVAPQRMDAQSTASREYQIKAAFLFNFAQFVQWPDAAFAGADAPFTIGVLGDDPFGKALDETIQGETLQNRKVVVVRSHRPADLQNCQLVFICKSERTREAGIIAAFDARNILTVGDIPGFADHGGTINFFFEGNKTRFEINPHAASRAGLKISSQLLSLGKIVESQPKGGG